MNKLSEEVILSAIAELKTSDDSKVMVVHLAKKLGVAPKTLYSERYKHLLEYCKPGVPINKDSSSLMSELMRTKNLLKQTQQDYEQLQTSLEKERVKIKKNTFSELFFDSAIVFDFERIKQETEGKTAQLNTKVNENKILEIEKLHLESKVQELKDSIRTMGKGSNNIKFTFFQPDLLLPNKAYSVDKKLSSWINKYKDACIKETLEIINKKFERVVLHIGNFNCKTEDICKSINYDSGKYAVLHTALFNAQQRRNIISEFNNANIKIYCIYTTSLTTASKLYCRQQQLPVHDTLIESLREQFKPPSLDEGFIDIYTRAIKNA